MASRVRTAKGGPAPFPRAKEGRTRGSQRGRRPPTLCGGGARPRAKLGRALASGFLTLDPRAPRARVPGAKGRDAARRGAKAEDHRTRLRTARGAEAAVLSRYRVTLVCCRRRLADGGEEKSPCHGRGVHCRSASGEAFVAFAAPVSTSQPLILTPARHPRPRGREGAREAPAPGLSLTPGPASGASHHPGLCK